MNKVLLIGRLASDVRSFTTSSGVPYSRATIAVNRRISSTNNEITDFIPLVGWREVSNILSNYTQKGSLIGIEGTFTTGQYKKGDEYVRTYDVTIERIELLESRSQFESRKARNTNNSNYSNDRNNNFFNSEKDKFVDNKKEVETESKEANKKFSFDLDLDD